MVIRHRSLRLSFGLCFITGLSFFAGVFYWIHVIGGFKLIDFFPLLAYFGLYYGLFGLAFNFISKKTAFPSVIAAPVLWVSLEYFRANAGFLSLPCALLGHSQYLHLPIIQISDITGVYGVSFLIVMVNAAVSEILYVLCSRFFGVSGDDGTTGKQNPHLAISVPATVIVLGISLVYGFSLLDKGSEGERLSISVIQPNIPQGIKWKREFRKQNLDRHVRLTKEAAINQDVSLIIWPESAVRGPIGQNSFLSKSIFSLAKETKAHLLIGSSQRPKFGPQEFRLRSRSNNAILISPKGRMEGQYQKIRLLPFGEYLPYRDTLPWPSRLISKIGNYIPGNEYTIFEVNGVRFGALICWESLFPGLVRQFVKRGADLMVNITNEAWFGETAVPYQFMAITVFRAVENRVPLARAANTGISCFIDPFGRVTGRVVDNNKDIFVEGYLTQEIPVSHGMTFYTRYGDVLAFVCIAFSLSLVLWSALRAIRGVSNLETRSTEGNS